MEKEKKGINKNLIWSIVSFLLAVFTIRAVLVFSKDFSLKDLYSTMLSSNKPLFIAGIVLAMLYVYFEAIALCSILKSAGYKTRKRKGVLYSTADVYFSAITPSATGGQPASALFMIRDGISPGVVTSTLMLNLIMYTTAIIVLGVLSFAIYPQAFLAFDAFSKIVIGVGFLILLLLLTFYILAFNRGDWLFRILGNLVVFLYDRKIFHEKYKKLKRLAKFSRDYRNCSEMIGGRKSVIIKAFIWNFLQRASQIAVPMVLYLSLGGLKGSAALVFAKQCMITVGYNFIPIPGAMGISDYLMIDGFTNLMGSELALNTVLLSRGLTFYICVLISGIITLIGHLKGVKKSDRGI